MVYTRFPLTPALSLWRGRMVHRLSITPVPESAQFHRAQMKDQLEALIRTDLAESSDGSATLEILRLGPKKDDFSSELIDSFEPKDRARLYLRLAVWCKAEAAHILRQRLNVEGDRISRKVIEVLLSNEDRWSK